MAQLNKREMSEFLMYRMIHPENIHTTDTLFPNRVPIDNSEDLQEYIKKRVTEVTAGRKAALALSGGIDSAILAKYMPEGSVAYTFKCIVPGVQVTDESPAAARYAAECGLDHRIVEVYWEDYQKYSEILMKHKGAPVHSIEVQIYKACLTAKADGFDTLIFGEAADAVYGGLSGLLSKDWTVGEFIERYSFLLPYMGLKEFEMPAEPIMAKAKDGFIDPHEFISTVFIQESIASYYNAASLAGMDLLTPYPETYLSVPIDYDRIRSGENKYLVREVFNKLYPGFEVPPKTPMPRPVAEWLKDWDGPKRDEFWPHCAVNLKGDQKYLLWILEKYLDMQD